MLNGTRDVAWFRLLHAILLIIFVASLVLCSTFFGASGVLPQPGNSMVWLYYYLIVEDARVPWVGYAEIQPFPNLGSALVIEW